MPKAPPRFAWLFPCATALFLDISPQLYPSHPIYVASWPHSSSFAKGVLSNPKAKRVIAYFAFTFVEPSLVGHSLREHLDDLAQMFPVYALVLNDAVDDKELEIETAIKAAKLFISDKKNSLSIRCAASWLISHKGSPVVQRGRKTLQSVLAEGIMKLALQGVDVKDFHQKFTLSLFQK